MEPTFVKTVIKNLVDGTLEQNLCRICLQPLGDICENIFTRICQADAEYSIADIFSKVFHIQFSEKDNYSVCSECFIATFAAYNFYLQFQQSNNILEYYTTELDDCLDQVDLSVNDSICLTLPLYDPKINNTIDPNIENCIYQDFVISHTEVDELMKLHNQKVEEEKNKETNENYEDVVLVISKNGEMFYNVQLPEKTSPVKKRKERKQLPYRKCSQCDFKHRFLVKLKKHMKQEHNLDFFICKVCKATMESEEEFNKHLQMHTNVHRCAICDTVFRKRETIIAHLKWHEDMDFLSQTDSIHVCELCGYILPNDKHLKEHYDERHNKKHACHYCGRMYRLELSLEKHIQKHELHKKSKEKEQTPKPKGTKKDKRFVCPTCNRNFVDERALKWHTMLHTDERPYKCETCGRGFITVNRRNQHALCAHSAPARRCPLCPALFHLRSMVNSHIKKVHLKTHKRRNRTSKHQNVSWRTETVPIEELSVDIQNEILELQTTTLDQATK